MARVLRAIAISSSIVLLLEYDGNSGSIVSSNALGVFASIPPILRGSIQSVILGSCFF